jgi:hypothetical protein
MTARQHTYSVMNAMIIGNWGTFLKRAIKKQKLIMTTLRILTFNNNYKNGSEKHPVSYLMGNGDFLFWGKLAGA